MKSVLHTLLLSLTFLVSASLVSASPQETGSVSSEDVMKSAKGPDGPVYSPYAGREYPDQVLFGDAHLHTNLSPDAGLLGTTLDVETAYRFARGEKVISNTGQPVQLIRPFDFLAITDHSEYIGLAPMIQRSDPVLLADEYGRWLHDKFRGGPDDRMEAFSAILVDAATGNNRLGNAEAAKTIWSEFVKQADTFNSPGVFTAMTGFEWTSTPGGDNLHRVVLLRDDASVTSKIVPYMSFDSFDPEDLWDWQAGYLEEHGGQSVAVPHNANLSNGLMFNGKDFKGNKITRAYAEKRQRWEPIHEMSQIKGDEETHPLLSPDDEFADFETWDVANLDGSGAKTEEMLQYEYARSALKIGLQLGRELGVNPYKMGFYGATDSHTGLLSTREENYFGKYANTEPSPNRHTGEVIPADDPELRILTSQESAAGLVAVWAPENTREAIFDAIQRKEVFATTGSRIRVRVFAGWEFTESDLVRHDFTARGYGAGVPMGGDLSAAPKGGAPRFLVRAMRDPDGANLDRLQVIKGWLDKEGNTHERIFDVAVSGDRKIGRNGRAKEAVGTTVNLDEATYDNSIGSPTLAAYWEDPDFDAAQDAFYYVRVLEIPTPRWTTYDAVFYDIKRPDNVPGSVQDRAYTSPIWYTP